MKLDYKKKKIQQDYREKTHQKTEMNNGSLIVTFMWIFVVVTFILNLFIDWL
jgi:hypothetical protein